MDTRRFVINPKLARPWVYFVATYAWTWLFFGIAYLVGVSAESNNLTGIGLILLALSGPAVMGIIFANLALNKEGRRDYFRRIIDFKRISLKFYLIILLVIPVICIIVAKLSGYWDTYSFSHKLPSLFLLILSVPAAPILEELGWRGYVLDRLQEKYSALKSSLILGALWGPWHLPAFFLSGSIFGLISFASMIFWLYMIHAIVMSVFFTWVYNNTARSTLSAILLHMVMEFCANTGLIPWDRHEQLYYVTIWILLCLALTWIYGAKKLSTHR